MFITNNQQIVQKIYKVATEIYLRKQSKKRKQMHIFCVFIKNTTLIKYTNITKIINKNANYQLNLLYMCVLFVALFIKIKLSM